jgi:CubicO group peptidase (beta-lactamase class C family)
MERVDPTSVGISVQGMDRLASGMQAYIERGQLAGIMTVLVRYGKIAYVGLHGCKDLSSNSPLEEDTIFRVFSMTKPVISLAVLMLREEGHFDLDTPIAAFMPALENLRVLSGQKDGQPVFEALQRPITIFDLLTHTSGIGYGLDASSPVEAIYQQAAMMRPDEPMSDKVRRLAELPLHHQPGERYTYSLGTDIAGHLVEKISDIPLDEFLRQRIFTPLGMPDTDFYVPPEKLHRLAALYTTGPDGRLFDLANYPGDPTQFPFGLWTDKSRKPAFLSGGGGLVSTAADFLRFGMMLRGLGELDGLRLVQPETIRMMTSAHLSPGQVNLPGISYGLGVSVLTDPALAQVPGSAGAYAAGGAAHTDFWYDPGRDLMGLLMTQYIHYTGLILPHEFKILAEGAVKS